MELLFFISIVDQIFLTVVLLCYYYHIFFGTCSENRLIILICLALLWASERMK